MLKSVVKVRAGIVGNKFLPPAAVEFSSYVQRVLRMRCHLQVWRLYRLGCAIGLSALPHMLTLPQS